MKELIDYAKGRAEKAKARQLRKAKSADAKTKIEAYWKEWPTKMASEESELLSLEKEASEL